LAGGLATWSFNVHFAATAEALAEDAVSSCSSFTMSTRRHPRAPVRHRAARRIGNVGNQAVEPFDIMLDDVGQALAHVVVLRQWQRFDGAA
jgi:hypothetical protein